MVTTSTPVSISLPLTLIHYDYTGTAHLIFPDGDGFIHRQVLTGFLRGQPVFLYRCGENVVQVPVNVLATYWGALGSIPVFGCTRWSFVSEAHYPSCYPNLQHLGQGAYLKRAAREMPNPVIRSLYIFVTIVDLRCAGQFFELYYYPLLDQQSPTGPTPSPASETPNVGFPAAG